MNKSQQCQVLELAERTNHYIQLHQASAAILRTDEPRLINLAKELEAQSPVVAGRTRNIIDPYRHGTGKDIIRALNAYDQVLSVTPTTFEEYFLLFHTAICAGILFNEHFVAPFLKEGPAFHSAYDKALKELNDVPAPETCASGLLDTSMTTCIDSPIPSEASGPPALSTSTHSTPPLIPKVTKQAALAYLANPDNLLRLQFITTLVGEPPLRWCVSSITKTMDTEKYTIAIDDLGDCMVYSAHELLEFMMEGSVEA